MPSAPATLLPSTSDAVGVVYLDELAPDRPDPDRPFWWFSTTPLSHLKLSAGCAVELPPGSRLPPEADYWCHLGEKWVRVDRERTPKPAPKPRKKSRTR
jgi:hypothetical protein